MIARRHLLASAVLIFGLYGCSPAADPQPARDVHPTDRDIAAKVRRGEISFSADDGTSFERAITVLGAEDAKEGVLAEYCHLENTLGPPLANWVRLRQKLVSHEARIYDVIRIRMANGVERDFYFDASDYYGQQRR